LVFRVRRMAVQLATLKKGDMAAYAAEALGGTAAGRLNRAAPTIPTPAAAPGAGHRGGKRKPRRRAFE
jgi:hypothetical protein